MSVAHQGTNQASGGQHQVETGPQFLSMVPWDMAQYSPECPEGSVLDGGLRIYDSEWEVTGIQCDEIGQGLTVLSAS